MTLDDAFGWAAFLMTLVTFVQNRMLPLRAAAITANLLFIGYGALGHRTFARAHAGLALPLPSFMRGKTDEPRVNRFTENPRRRCHSSA